MSTQISIPTALIEFISVSTETKLALPVVSENISAVFLRRQLSIVLSTKNQIGFARSETYLENETGKVIS